MFNPDYPDVYWLVVQFELNDWQEEDYWSDLLFSDSDYDEVFEAAMYNPEFCCQQVDSEEMSDSSF